MGNLWCEMSQRQCPDVPVGTYKW